MPKHVNATRTAIVLAVSAYSCLCSAAAPPLPTGRRIREIVAEKYPTGHLFVGATTAWAKRKNGAGVTIGSYRVSVANRTDGSNLPTDAAYLAAEGLVVR